MKVKVAVYEEHDVALKAVEALRISGFPAKQISLLGKADEIEENLHLVANKRKESVPLFLGMGAGTVTGLLTGLGVFAVPGFGVLYGAGAIIGTLAGFQLGAVGGGVASLLTTAGIETAEAHRHSEHLEHGRYLIFLSGTSEEIEGGGKVLYAEGNHIELT